MPGRHFGNQHTAASTPNEPDSAQLLVYRSEEWSRVDIYLAGANTAIPQGGDQDHTHGKGTVRIV